MAKKFIVDKNDIEIYSIGNDNIIKIKGSEVKHIQVLRHNISDEIIVNNHLCSIVEIKKDSIVLEKIKELPTQGESSVNVVLFTGLLKGEKMDFVVQKATELGVNKIVPFISRNVVVKLDDKGKMKKQEKYNKITIEACKQCGRSGNVEVENIINLKELDKYINKEDITIFAYEKEKETIFNAIEVIKNKLNEVRNLENNSQNIEIKNNLKGKNINVVIGAEGGFDKEEIEAIKNNENLNVSFVSLGTRILRAETAVINLLSIVMYEFDR